MFGELCELLINNNFAKRELSMTLDGVFMSPLFVLYLKDNQVFLSFSLKTDAPTAAIITKFIIDHKYDIIICESFYVSLDGYYYFESDAHDVYYEDKKKIIN